jgi:hypothetical protein
MKHLLTTVAASVLLVSLASFPSAQSLGDVARKEEARRKTAKAGKVYTNDNLRGGSGDSTPAPVVPPSMTAGGEAGAPGAEAKPAPEAKPDPSEDRKTSEKFWRDRIEQARMKRERAQSYHEALQSRINALTTDFASRDDPAQRAVIGTNRQKALAELERAAKEAADAEKEIASIEEEARRAGVPPGWLR